MGARVFYDGGAKAIFVGDALRTDNNSNLQKPGFNADDEQAKSLNLIASLSFVKLYPCHKVPITEKASEKLTSFIKDIKSQ